MSLDLGPSPQNHAKIFTERLMIQRISSKRWVLILIMTLQFSELMEWFKIYVKKNTSRTEHDFHQKNGAWLPPEERSMNSTRRTEHDFHLKNGAWLHLKNGAWLPPEERSMNSTWRTEHDFHLKNGVWLPRNKKIQIVLQLLCYHFLGEIIFQFNSSQNNKIEPYISA